MNARTDADRSAALQATLRDLDPAGSATQWLQTLVAAGLDRLPPPGRGATLARWQALAAVAAFDLSLAKLYEGHTDALAILAELGAAPVGDAATTRTWGVWAAEAPQGRATISGGAAGSAGWVRLDGAKCWCSGGLGASDALLTAWRADDVSPQLVHVELRQPGVRVCAAAWQAVGMAGSASVDVAFDAARAQLVGAPGDYLRRAGFWHGGAGIAACWYGGALGLAETLRQATAGAAAASRGPFRLAALGRVDLALQATAAVLRQSAAWIDANPAADARATTLRARLAAEACASAVLDDVGRALGATPFCRDARFARAAADLPVFIRQSHAERDLAALGERVLDAEDAAWSL